MCSTPRPRTTVKGKANYTGSVLSNMSVEARSRFAQRANQAEERRHQRAIEKHQTENLRQHHNNKSVSTWQKKRNATQSNSQHKLSYWLINASLKEILAMLLGKSTQA